MASGRVCLWAWLIVLAATCRADFKYTTTSQITGGALVIPSKTASVFSKNARQMTEPPGGVRILCKDENRG